ncbi:nuclear transport factor 2 family protein [Altererythrobacter sp.]|uniref:nuclear transport factor 2 family protein n=1 Tax=Altererythrobacter sp. TaxID=1872480 RepID=UPI003CFDCBC2
MKSLIAGALAVMAFVFGGTSPAYAEQPAYAEDRAAIEELMARYLFAMDWNDFDSYAETFTEDGELVFATGAAKGRQAIRDMARKFKQRLGEIYRDEDGNPAVLRHVLGHTSIRVEGDRAWSRGFWYEMGNTGPGKTPEIGSFGTYADELVRIDGRWFFTKREVFNEFLEGRGTRAENPVRRMDAQADEMANGEVE